MLVICASHNRFDIGDIPYGPSDPQIGDICEVIGECPGYNSNDVETPCYELAGYGDWVYDQRDFAEITDLDETELVTEEFEEKYCVPVTETLTL